MAKLTYVGPWGDSEGKMWFNYSEGKISKLIIWHSDYIHCISFQIDDFKTEDMNIRHLFGSSNVDDDEFVIDTDKGEYLTEISGAWGDIGSGKKVVTSLQFRTNEKESRVYGKDKETGTPFSLPVYNGSFAGFFGCYGHGGITAIGAVLMPM